jgi:TonB family protein
MWVLWFAAGIVSPQSVFPQSVPSGARLGTSDAHLRQWAIASPPPQYPRASLAKRVTGVVVVTTLFTEKGAPQAVDIIQSPDAETGRSVREALLLWRLKPMPVPVEATLAFYFQMNGQTGVVLNPVEMRALISPGAKNLKREDEPHVKHITEAEYRALSTQPRTLLLDIRDRETFAEGHEKGAVNIPLREVLLRAPAELPVSRHVVIDCREPLDSCAMAVHWLASNGFERVSILRR